MDIRSYMTKGVAIVGITVASMLASPSASAGEHSAKAFFKTFYKVPAAAITMPYKVVKSTVKELNPVAGLRRGVIDIVETTALGLTAHDSVAPHKYGRANQEIDERPGLKFVVDVAFGAGVGAGIGSLVNEASRGAVIGAGSQFGIGAISDAYGINHEDVYAKEFTEREHYAKSGGDRPFARQSTD